MKIQEKIDDFIDNSTKPQFIVIIFVELLAVFMCFYIPYWIDKTYETPKYIKYGLPLRNTFPYICEMEICPNEWTPCRNINDITFKNIQCD